MKNSSRILLVVAAIIIIFGASAVKSYNSLMVLEEDVDAKWAQVENQLQRRADLVPNLVRTVKGYASHEEKVFTEIADARARLLGAGTPEEQMRENAGLDSALGRLLALSEAYPELKADTNFIRLQDELAGTENRIAYERMQFNESIQSWNTTIRKFPMNILAGIIGKETKAFFEAAPGSREVPEVQF